MAEIFDGGYAVEYICRVIDETGGNESVPETATVAQINLNGKNRKRENGKKSAEHASDSNTNILLNSSLRVATPVLDGFTDGVASQVIGKGKQVVNMGKAIAKGAGTAAIVSAVIPFVVEGVTKAVQAFLTAKANNDALAKSIDATNLQRQMAGLEKINYVRTGITGKIRMEGTRQ